MPIRVLIVDDQAVVRAGLRAFFAEAPDMHLVGEAEDGADAVRLAADTRPDVVVTEMRLPGLDGAELIRRLRQGRGDGASPRVIILTTHDLDRDIFAALHAGASGFLLKDVPSAQLLAAIRAVAAGDAVTGPTVTRRLVDRLLTTHAGVDPELTARLARLTAREQEILELIATGLSNADIAVRLFVSIGTVKAHVSRILTKLGVCDRVQAVVLAYRAGLVPPAAPVRERAGGS